MDNVFVILGIIVWVVGTIVKATRSMKGSTPPTVPPPTVPRVRQPVRPPVVPQQTGYATRGQIARNPDQSRAMQGAKPRLAEGAEYGPIVAERAADRAAELRFAEESRQLINSEAKPAKIVPTVLVGQDQFSALQTKLAGLSQDKTALVSAIILSEILSPPLCKGRRARQ